MIKNFKDFLKECLLEGLEIETDKLIICDIQPAMEKFMKDINLLDFMNMVESYKGNILYLYLGEEMDYTDNPEKIKDWFVQENSSIKISKMKNITWFEKTYGWFRDVLDEYDYDTTIQVVEFLKGNNLQDVRDCSDEQFQEMLDLGIPEDLVENLREENLNLHLPDESLIKALKKFNGATLIGGDKKQCLMELQILMDVYGIDYKNNFTYQY